MDEILYLEADEEITSVVDKLKGLEASSIGLVAPKGSTIVQSVVSLKLLKKEAEKQNKEIALITSDEVGRNLASQVGLVTYADVKSQTPLPDSGEHEIDELREPIEIDMSKDQSEKPAEEKLPEGFNVHRYDDAKEKTQEKNEVTSNNLVAEAEVAQTVLAQKAEGENAEEDTSEGFIQREVIEHPIVEDRAELEAARPIRYGENHEIKKQNPSKKKKIIIISVLAVVLLILIFLADSYFTKLTVKLLVNADPIEKEATATVSKDVGVVDFDNSIIPGVQIQKEKDVNGTFDSTGQKDAGEKAKGTLTFRNNDGSQQTITAGTIVRSSSGVDFVLDSTISVPGATVNMGQIVLGKNSGSVTAKDSGLQGNMSSSVTYAVTGKSGLIGDGATSGGVTKKVKVVSQSDIDKAKASLTSQQLSDALTDEDKAKGLMLVDGSGLSELSGFTTSKNVGDVVDNFTASGKLKFTAIAFKTQDLRDVVTKSIEKTLPESKGLLQNETDSFTALLKSSDVNVGKLSVSGDLKSHIGPKINIPEIEKSWRLKPIKKVRESFSGIDGVTVQDVSLAPNFVLPLGPLQTSNIKINLEYNAK